MTNKSHSPLVAPSHAIHLASLLDLASRIGGVEPAIVLNAAVLSVMGRLRIMRACVMQPQGKQWVAEPHLCKGVSPFAMRAFEVTGIADITSTGPLSADVRPLVERGIHRLVPLVSGDMLVGVLALGPMFDKQQDDDGVRSYLELVSIIVGTAVVNAEMVTALHTAKKELEERNLLVTTLYESARDFTTAQSRDELMRLLSYRVMGQLMVSSFAIFLVKPLDGKFVLVSGRDIEGLHELRPTILGITKPTFVSDMPSTDMLKGALEFARIEMATPIVLHGDIVGVIATRGKLNAKPFTSEELQFLESIGNTAMIALENSRLVDEELEKLRIESELSIAADIQRGLLPIELPVIDGLDVAADTRSSRQIGGDYYDVIRLDEDRTLFVIADAAGKGIPAALLMANVQAAINVLSKLDLPLATLAQRINTLVCENTEPEVFITLFLCVVNMRTSGLEYVNAGHNPPILIHQHDAQLLTEGGLLVGVVPEPPAYNFGVGTLAVGDVLVLYTDGVTEARKGFVEYGLHRLQGTVLAAADKSAKAILDSIHAEVQAFVGPEHLHDDTSLLILKVLPRLSVGVYVP